jgi:regulatory protein
VAELRSYLERKRVEPEAIEHAVGELTAAGYLDDARFARRFAEDKRHLERWGSERIGRDLRRRGVPPDFIEVALSGQERDEELRAAIELLAMRMPVPPVGARERERAWRMLVRKGYEAELAHDAVRAHGRQAAA